MKTVSYKTVAARARARGFSLLELIIVVAVALVLAGIMVPEYLRISYNIRLKNAATNISALIQQTRILAIRQNATYTLYMPTSGGYVCIDLNNHGQCEAGDPTIYFSKTVGLASAAPTGSGAYSLAGDTGGTVYTNGTTLGYARSGLPCSYSSGTCSTPAGGYFVYYFADTRPGGTTGLAAIVITRTGRSKVVTWNGGSWN